MTIKRLAVSTLRNLDAVDLELDRRVNFFYGSNGSGKTSLLEGVSILAHGRSFRSHLAKSVIQHEQPKLTVFAQVIEDSRVVPVGIERSRTKPPVIKVDGEVVQSIAQLAQRLPLLVLDSHSFLLLEGSPKERRQLLDWLVFHVKPDFIGHWQRYQRCLKQRNSALRRDRIRPSELAVWDRELGSLGAAVSKDRHEVFSRLTPAIEGLLQSEGFSDRIQNVQLAYSQGWPEDRALEECLADSFARDVKAGYSHVGPHRADIEINVGGHKASEVLSRGQQKVVVSALKLAQAQLVKEITGKACTFLVDDLPAELDVYHQQQLATWLTKLDAQVFITGVDKQELLNAWSQVPQDAYKVFHVEHGQVKPIKLEE